MDTSAPVFILDDEESSIGVVQQHLTVLGFSNVISAKSVNAALQLWDSLDTVPQFCVCDLFMPDQDGVEFNNALAQRGFEGGLILMTSKDPQWMNLAATLAQGRGLNVWATLIKPVFLGDLARALEAGQGQLP